MKKQLSRRFFFKCSTVGLVTLALFDLSTIANAVVAQENNNSVGKETDKILVAYFSWSGNTRRIARQVHQKVGGDLFEITLERPYSSDYDTVLDQAKRDQERQARPQIKNQVPNMAQYDVIFLGYPNWWASIPMPIASFLEGYDFSGKRIFPFCSHGGGRFGQSLSAIAKLSPQAKVMEALSVSYSGGRSLPDDISTWLRKVKIAEK